MPRHIVCSSRSYLLRELGGEDDFDFEAKLCADPVGDGFIEGGVEELKTPTEKSPHSSI